MQDSDSNAPPAVSSRVWTIPNVLSLLRLASVPLFIYLFVSDREEAAVILYGAFAWTDFFDGVIARRFNQVSELGKLLDPLADRVFIIALAVALVATEALPWGLAAAIVGRDLILLAGFPILERRGVPRIRVNFTGKTATAALLFGLTWLAWAETSFPITDTARVLGMSFTIFGAVAYWVAASMYGRQALDYLRAPQATAGGR